MEQDTIAFEKKIAKAYERFAPLASAYYHAFSRTAVTVGGVPAVLFLGNHSSGKSSLINWILGGSSVQDTGVAPTDDGFTVILFGETEKDVNGPAALAELPAEYAAFHELGPSFLQHLRVKVRNRDVLRRVCLVDSPGMIDTAEGIVRRDYDFFGAVRRFAGLCDMVFFLFDPEKPGTTGETVEVFSRCLRGVDFKLRVLLNKCDTFSGIYDFARAYGTLCWNLARVLNTKDLPKIYTTYSGDRAAERPGAPDLADVERHRAEFRAVFNDPGARRADNVFAAARSDFARLAVRMRVVNRAARIIAAFHVFCEAAASVLALGLAAVVLGWTAKATGADLYALSAGSVLAWTLAAGVAALVAVVSRPIIRAMRRLNRAALGDDAQKLFEQSYRLELVSGARDDLLQDWEAVREGTVDVIHRAPLDLPMFGERKRARVETVLAGLRRDVAR